MFQVVLIHYNEIGLKGGNRRMFERQLQNNIQQKLDALFVDESFFKPEVKWQYGRLYIENFVLTDCPAIKDCLQKTFGIANFVLAEKTMVDFDAIKQKITGFLCHFEAKPKNLKCGGGRSWQSFRVTSKRAQKDFPLTSQQINEQLGGFIQKETGARVDLKNPDIIFYVEIVNKSAFIYINLDHRVESDDDAVSIIQGAGGLPVGVSGKAVCLLSGGIDSPVAAWLAMKRGLQVCFIHFHSAPQTDTASQDKVKRIVGVLSRWQSPLNDNLTMTPFLDFQKKVLTKTIAKYRVILYRREMMRQAEKLAREIGAKAIITGEALGQVASQTIENLAVIEQAVILPVLRPLICFDKQEIIALAQKISTYEISTEPHQDCCSLFVPEHPATKANLADILKIEKSLNLDA